MHYEINVSLNGEHFFATHSRSIVDSRKLKEVYGEMVERFPRSDGFAVSVVRVETTGRHVDMSEI
jgi:hypothetical protein